MTKSIKASALAAVALTGTALIASQARALLIEIFRSGSEGSVEVRKPAPPTLLGGGLPALGFVIPRVAQVRPSHGV